MCSRRVQCFALIALAIASRSAASEDHSLQIIISDIGNTELLVITQSEQLVEWKLVTPQNGEARGRAKMKFSLIEEAFKSVVNMQTDESQRQRVEDAREFRFRPTFNLMLVTGVRQISFPLTDREHQAFVKTIPMQSIIASVKSERVLRKPQLIARFFDLNPSGGASNPNANQVRDTENNSPWEKQGKQTKEKGVLNLKPTGANETNEGND